MKKYLILFVILFSMFILPYSINAKEITHNTDLYGNITFDIKEIEKENNYNLSGEYILAKESENSKNVILILQTKNTIFKYDGYNVKARNEEDTKNDYKIIMIYNNNTKKFEESKNDKSITYVERQWVYYDSTNCTKSFKTIEIELNKINKIVSNDYIKDIKNYQDGLNNAMKIMNINNEEDFYIITYDYLKKKINAYWTKKENVIKNPNINVQLDRFWGSDQYPYWVFNLNIELKNYNKIEYDIKNNKIITKIENEEYIKTYMELEVCEGTIKRSKLEEAKYDTLKEETIKVNNLLYKTNYDIKFSNEPIYYNEKFHIYYNGNPLMINDNENKIDYAIINNQIIINKNLTLNIKPAKPEIKVSIKETGYDKNKNKISSTININFTKWDTEKYIYQYAIEEEKKDKIYNWVDILKNDYEYTSFSNKTMLIRVIDKIKYYESLDKLDSWETNTEEVKIVEEVITSMTYKFSGIKTTIPDIEFSVSIPDACKLTVNGKAETICKNVNAKINNYNDINVYRYEVAYNNGEYLPIYSETYGKRFGDNGTINFRLLDVKNNKYIKFDSMTITGITKGFESLGQYITFEGKFNKKEYYYDLKAYFYNYDSNTYNYYYSIDKASSWQEIEPSSVHFYTGSPDNPINYSEFYLYEDCNFIIKIEDKTGKYINSYSFKVNYTSAIKKDMPIKNISEYLNNLDEDTSTVIKQFNEVYTKIRNSSLGKYIFLLIATSLITLLLGAFIRR